MITKMSDGTQSMWLYGAISDEALEIAPIQYLLNLQFDKLCDTQWRIKTFQDAGHSQRVERQTFFIQFFPKNCMKIGPIGTLEIPTMLREHPYRGKAKNSKEKMKNGKHQGKCSLPLPLSLGVNKHYNLKSYLRSGPLGRNTSLHGSFGTFR